jgi:hypothetical protein
MSKNSLPRNPVAKHMHKSVRASVVLSKRRSLQSEATLREMSEVVSESQIDSQTMCFDDDLQGCMTDVGCSSVYIDCEEG